MSAQYEDSFKCRLTLTSGDVREFEFYTQARAAMPNLEDDILSFTTDQGVENFTFREIATIQIGLPGADLSRFPL